jgi:hypothetical protein
VHLSPGRDERGAVGGLEFVEARSVHQSRYHFARFEGQAHIGRDNAQQLVYRNSASVSQSRKRECAALTGVVDRRIDLAREIAAGEGRLLVPVERGHDLSAEIEGVVLVLGEVVAHTTHATVHLRATQRLGVGHFTRRSFDERRTCEEHFGLILSRCQLRGPCNERCALTFTMIT